MNEHEKFAGFEYTMPITAGLNLGDLIQSIAVEQHHPPVEKRFNRENLANLHADEPYLLVMNGWFAHLPQSAFPPTASIRPIFFGFHIDKYTAPWFTEPQCIDYFRQHQPIGCRDRRTAEILTAKGVETYYAKCVSLTFPRRQAVPDDGEILFVDADHIPAPESLRQRAVFLHQRFDKDLLDIHISLSIQTDYEIQERMAKILLRKYQTAALVVTTRLHCALPCIAMGVPVVFFGDENDSRISIVKDFNVPINKMMSAETHRRFYRANKSSRSVVSRLIKRTLRPFINRYVHKHYVDTVNWSPAPIEMESEKADIIRSLKAAIDHVKSTSPQDTA